MDIEQRIDQKIQDLLKGHNFNEAEVKPKEIAKNIMVLSGGGPKGLVYIGAFKALDELNLLSHFHTFAGSSIGSLMAALVVLGFKPAELWTFFSKFDLSKIKNTSVMNILSKYGLDDGARGEKFIQKLIKTRGFEEDITLLELYKKTKKRLVIVVTCVNSWDPVYMDYQSHPSVPLYMALKMSMSVPFMVTPTEYDGELYTDGGCTDNYPIRIFKDQIDKVLGLYIESKKEYVEKIDNIETYSINIIKCMMRGINLMLKHGYEDKTITFHMEGFNIVDVNIEQEKKEEMFVLGYNTVMEYYK